MILDVRTEDYKNVDGFSVWSINGALAKAMIDNLKNVGDSIVIEKIIDVRGNEVNIFENIHARVNKKRMRSITDMKVLTKKSKNVVLIYRAE